MFELVRLGYLEPWERVKMIAIMTAKKLKIICDDYYGRGVAKGYEFGY